MIDASIKDVIKRDESYNNKENVEDLLAVILVIGWPL